MKSAELKTILLIIVFLAVCSAAFAAEEKNFINRLFFEDFVDIGRAVADNPVPTLIITGSVVLAGGLIFVNDRAIADAMKVKNDFNDTFFDYANRLGDGLTVIAANSFLFLGGQKERKAAQLVIESVLVSGAIVQVLKAGIGRARPSSTNDPYKFTPFTINDLTMPSGHTQVAFSWATILGDTYDIGWLTYPVAGLVAWARVYKSAHWPSDVLIGGVIGTVTAKILKAARDKEDETMQPEIRYSQLGTLLVGISIKL